MAETGMTSPALEYDANSLAGRSQQPAMQPGSALEATLQVSQQEPSGVVIAQDLTRLIDLPDAWLLQLASRLHPDACLAVFQTCQAMRDLMLSLRRRVRTLFYLPLALDTAADDQLTLQRACQQCQAVMLVCDGLQSTDNNDNTASARSLITGTMSSLGHPLSAITSVELRFLRLDGLVPTWLRSACPNMTSLTLKACSYSSLPDSTTSIPTCGQLQALCLEGLQHIDSSQLADDHWQHQFRSLTGLQQLSIDSGALCRWEQQLEQWLQCCATVGTQLTRLNYCKPWSFSQLSRQLPAWFPSIVELNIPIWVLEDRDMEVLLRMPSLKTLWFREIQLRHSYAHRPCRWTDVHFSVIEVEMLARWPLGGKPLLHAVQYKDEGFVVFPGWDLQDTDSYYSSVAAITACGGIQWGSVDDVELRLPNFNETSAAASLSILSGYTASHVSVVADITPSLLNTLAPHLASLPVTDVTFDDCYWADQAACALLLPSLPAQVRNLRLRQRFACSLTEARLTEVCVHAIRGVTLQVSHHNTTQKWDAGWQQRVQDAMRAAGHAHVTLMDGEE